MKRRSVTTSGTKLLPKEEGAIAPSKVVPEPKLEQKQHSVLEKVDFFAKFNVWFPDLSAASIDRLFIYYFELLRFNKTINLISLSTVKNAESVHVADAVFASRLILPAMNGEGPLFDFGSGNGCPGLVFAALNPLRPVVLVDRDSRKLEFCKHAASAMGLKHLTVLESSVEELESQSVKFAVARGFAPFSRSLLLCRKQFIKDGRFFHMKSDGWANELAQMPSQVFSHWTPSLLGQYRLPEIMSEMFVVITDKISE